MLIIDIIKWFSIIIAAFIGINIINPDIADLATTITSSSSSDKIDKLPIDKIKEYIDLL